MHRFTRTGTRPLQITAVPGCRLPARRRCVRRRFRSNLRRRRRAVHHAHLLQGWAPRRRIPWRSPCRQLPARGAHPPPRIVTICSSVNRVFCIDSSVARGRHCLKLRLIRTSPGRSGRLHPQTEADTPNCWKSQEIVERERTERKESTLPKAGALPGCAMPRLVPRLESHLNASGRDPIRWTVDYVDL